jgi:hypothetical protein
MLQSPLVESLGRLSLNDDNNNDKDNDKNEQAKVETTTDESQQDRTTISNIDQQ